MITERRYLIGRHSPRSSAYDITTNSNGNTVRTKKVRLQYYQTDAQRFKTVTEHPIINLT